MKITIDKDSGYLMHCRVSPGNVIIDVGGEFEYEEKTFEFSYYDLDTGPYIKWEKDFPYTGDKLEKLHNRIIKIYNDG